MATQLFDLRGRVALVTGGSKGLGKAMARGLAEAGAQIAISSRHEDELRQATAEIARGTDVKVAWFKADMTQRPEVRQLAERVVKEFGRVDILINNAGGNLIGAIDEIRDEDWDRVIELNLTSCMALTRALVPQMKKRRWGASFTSRRSWVSPPRNSATPIRRPKARCWAWPAPTPWTWRFQHHGQLPGSGTVLDRPAGQVAQRRAKEGLRQPHRLGALGRAERIGRAGTAVGQRGRGLHHRGFAGRRRRHAGQDFLSHSEADRGARRDAPGNGRRAGASRRTPWPRFKRRG